MLYLLYDTHCGFCRELKQWLSKQKVVIRLGLVVRDTNQAWLMFSTLATPALYRSRAKPS